MYYILIGRTPVHIGSEPLPLWALWFGYHHNSIRREVIPPRKPFNKGNPKMLRKVNNCRQQPIVVSTIFLGIDHNWHVSPHDDASPILFETMIFKDNKDTY